MTDHHFRRGDFFIQLTDMVTGDAGVAHVMLRLIDEGERSYEATGRSWRSQEDAPNTRIGRRLAAARALDGLARQLHREAWQEIHDNANHPNNTPVIPVTSEDVSQPKQEQAPLYILSDGKGRKIAQPSNGAIDAEKSEE